MIYSKGDIILLPYPFTNLTVNKVRPAVVVGSDGEKYDDIFVVPLTSKIHTLSENEFCLENWRESGLNVPTAVKRGCILVDIELVIKKVGVLSNSDLGNVGNSLRAWLEL